MSNETKVEVTFKVQKGRTLTFAGSKVADGEKREVTPRQKERLAKAGHITAQPKPSNKPGE